MENTFSDEAKKEKERKESIAKTSVYINSGGRGTRLESIFPKDSTGVTKAMIEFAGKPMIQHHADLITKLGFKNVIIGAGDHYNVRDFFQDKESDNLIVINSEEQEDTAGDLIKAIRDYENFGENVLVENVDTIAYVKDLAELIGQHDKSGADATIVLTTKKGVPNEGAFYVDEQRKVIFCGEAREELSEEEPKNWNGFRGSSTGIILFKTETLRHYDWKPGEGRKLSLYKDVIPQLVKQRKVFAYNNEKNIFIDIGTPERYSKVKRHEDKIFGALDKRYGNQLPKN